MFSLCILPCVLVSKAVLVTRGEWSVSKEEERKRQGAREHLMNHDPTFRAIVEGKMNDSEPYTYVMAKLGESYRCLSIVYLSLKLKKTFHSGDVGHPGPIICGAPPPKFQFFSKI